jgi:serine/threonine-protein kinase
MIDESLLGLRLGQFEIRAELGRGAMGLVYRAYQSSLDREVALKVLPQWLAQQPGVSSRFLAEARAAARLRHRNIVTIHDVGNADGVHYIVMELLPGRTLDRVLMEDGPLVSNRLLRIAQQLADGLDYAHRHGVIHRDVKPANIIVDDHSHVTLTDFGIARVVEDSLTKSTQTGVAVGTPQYMAPEQAEGRTVTGAADEYGLACVLFEMLAETPPFSGPNTLEILRQHIQNPPPALSTLREDTPVALDRIFSRALAKQPAIATQPVANW